MVIKSFLIENFKSIRSLEIVLDSELSVLTGANNSGKTTILEALSLWVECFNLMATKAGRSVRGKFQKGEYILGATNNQYVNFGYFKSVQSPDFQDIFCNLNMNSKIRLVATLYDAERGLSLDLGFQIGSSTHSRYAIRHDRENSFDYATFHRMFVSWPQPIGVYLSSPVANIQTSENYLTTPQIDEKIAQKESFNVMRNRLYNLYYSKTLFPKFQEDLSYILFGTDIHARIHFISRSDVNRDTKVIIRYTIDNETVEKDLALLGSGSLQTIEILLNIYHYAEVKKDMYLILLDEPDSHIHRDVQKRLFEVLSRVTDNNQIVLTTHNEALIRSTPLHQIFHIDNTAAGKIKCLSSQDLTKLNIPHFNGIYPSAVRPVIKSLNSSTAGLDFVNAIEADLLVFVEGDSDARLLNYLLYQNVANRNKRIMFWVLGGIAKVFDNIGAYKKFFSEIKNGKSLWEKSCLVFDQDYLSDEHKRELLTKLKDSLKLRTKCLNVYTQESMLLTDIPMLARLLKRHYGFSAEIDDVTHALGKVIAEYEKEKKAAISVDNRFIREYRGKYLRKMNETLRTRIEISDIDLEHALRDYYDSCPLYKLADKRDVAEVINRTLQLIAPEYSYAQDDFSAMVKLTDANDNYLMWQELTQFLTDCAK